MWTSQPLSVWPGPLPQGIGGKWTGWSQQPDASSHWPRDAREKVFQSLSRQYAEAGLEPPATLVSLQNDQCRVVTVGHQLVLAGGPAFFHHKILSAIRTARMLSKEMGIPVVPLFWMATEDHDWQEVSVLEGESSTHRWRPLDADRPHPVGRRGLDGIEAALSAWVEDLSEPGIATEVLEEFHNALAQGETLAGLMRRWLHRWYAHEGLLAFDADDPALKTFASALWAAEFEGRGIHSILEGRAEMKGPAHVRRNNVFWMDDDAGRAGVVRAKDGGMWQAGEIQVAKVDEDWTTWAKTNARHCSPGVLLRPLYQELLLHSVAVVVGPGEWGYWHQLPDVFAKVGVAFPALRMRDHAVVHTPETIELGWDLGLGWMHAQDWDRWVLDRWLEELGPELNRQEAELRQWQERQLEWVRHEAPELEGPTAAFTAATDKAWGQWMTKMRRALKGTRAKEWARAQQAHASLVRDGKPQDRWASWHVLSGGDWGRWNQMWLDGEEGVEALVWAFVPREAQDNDAAENSADRN